MSSPSYVAYLKGGEGKSLKEEEKNPTPLVWDFSIILSFCH